jgi:hypothetical protein
VTIQLFGNPPFNPVDRFGVLILVWTRPAAPPPGLA